jgi:hypothetical protein
MAAPFSLANLVHEQSTTTGTGNFILSQISGKQTFSAAFGTGTTTDIFEYFISNEVANEWEHGTGHMTDSLTLVRDTIWDSSNSGSAVSFSSGTKDVTQAISAQALWAPRGYIDGMVCSNDSGTPSTKLDVAAGLCRDDTDALCIRFASSKTIDCTTTGANGLDTGALAASTWYYMFAIGKRDGSAQAALASTSASTPTLPSGYAYKRRIGAFKTDASSHILAFSQVGDVFMWGVPVGDVNTTNPGTSAVTQALTVPTGIVVEAIIYISVRDASTAPFVLVTPLSVADTTPSASAFNIEMQGSTNHSVSTLVRVLTNTSAQIRTRWSTSGASDTWKISTHGWIDQRGKNA